MSAPPVRQQHSHNAHHHSAQDKHKSGLSEGGDHFGSSLALMYFKASSMEVEAK
jgi:hypothetical protein